MHFLVTALTLALFNAAAGDPQIDAPEQNFETALAEVCIPFLAGARASDLVSSDQPSISHYGDSALGRIQYRVGSNVIVSVDAQVDQAHCAVAVMEGNSQQLRSSLDQRLAAFHAAAVVQDNPYSRLELYCADSSAPHETMRIGTNYPAAVGFPVLTVEIERRAFRNQRCDGDAPQLADRFDAALRVCSEIVRGAEIERAGRGHAFLFAAPLPVAEVSFDPRFRETFGPDRAFRQALDLDFHGDGDVFNDPNAGWIAILSAETGDRCMAEGHGRSDFALQLTQTLTELGWVSSAAGTMRGPRGETVAYGITSASPTTFVEALFSRARD